MTDKPRIFIASRFEEFQSFRAQLAARAARFEEALPFTFVNLDDGQADTRSALDRSIGEVERCAGMVLLLGKT